MESKSLIVFRPTGESIEFQAAMEFVTDKVKDSIKGSMREGQMDIFKDAEGKKKAESEAEEQEQKALAPSTPELTSGKVIEADFTKEEGAANDQ